VERPASAKPSCTSREESRTHAAAKGRIEWPEERANELAPVRGNWASPAGGPEEERREMQAAFGGRYS
jgi:hypothetical protein